MHISLRRSLVPVALLFAAWSTAPTLEAQVKVRDRGAQGAKKDPKKEEADAPVALGEGATRAVLTYYERSEDWPIKALSLLRLGSYWHPVGAPIVAKALGEKDVKIRIYALAALKRTRADVLRAVATEDLIDALIKLAKKGKQPFAADTLAVMRAIADDSSLEDRKAFEKWWRKQKKNDYAPKAWPKPPVSGDSREAGKTSAGVISKALDLRDSGLDLAIVIDATGSMGGPIAACTSAMDDLIALLGDLAPKFRAGVVVYRDFEDMKNGAKIEVELSPFGKDAKEKLSRVAAGGGGDVPERVEKGFELAVSREMRWRPMANKLVVIIGDAPPHPETERDLLALVTKARKDPASVLAGGPVTGQNKVKPFLTSCIAAHPNTARPFKEIAEAGGGVFAQLNFDGRGGARGQKGASREVAAHILRLSFGAQWQKQADAFAAIYFEWLDRGVIR